MTYNCWPLAASPQGESKVRVPAFKWTSLLGHHGEPCSLKAPVRQGRDMRPKRGNSWSLNP